MLGFDTRDKGKRFRITMNKIKQFVQRDGLLVFDGHSVNVLAWPCLASSQPLDHLSFISGDRNDTGDQARKSKLRTDPWNRRRGIADIVKAQCYKASQPGSGKTGQAIK